MPEKKKVACGERGGVMTKAAGLKFHLLIRGWSARKRLWSRERRDNAVVERRGRGKEEKNSTRKIFEREFPAPLRNHWQAKRGREIQAVIDKFVQRAVRGSNRIECTLTEKIRGDVNAAVTVKRSIGGEAPGHLGKKGR